MSEACRKGRREYVLLVCEDNADDELLVMRAFDRADLSLKIKVARDGEHALRELELDGRPVDGSVLIPDLILCDFKMPKLNGDKILSLVRAHEQLKDVPFIIFTSSDDLDAKQYCLELGATEYVVKPIDFEKFMAAAMSILTRWLPKSARPAL